MPEAQEVTEMDFRHLLLEKEEGIATIKINRPHVMNALNLETFQELRTAVEDVRQDAAVRVVVITGEGNKAFCAGRDLKEMEAYLSTGIEDWEARMKGIAGNFAFIEKLEKPTIASINGYALAGGCELALACDIRIASQHAKFGLTEIEMSVFPGAGAAWLLPRIVGKSRALELVLTGDRIDAREAERIGLVNRVVPQDKLNATVKELAGKIASKNPSAVTLAKAAISEAAEAPIESARAVAIALRALAETTQISSEERVKTLWASAKRRKQAD